jgi:hypothetical protein
VQALPGDFSKQFISGQSVSTQGTPSFRGLVEISTSRLTLFTGGNMRYAFLKWVFVAATLIFLINGSIWGVVPYTCSIDGYVNSRVDSGWSVINGTVYTGLRAKLNNPAFFSPASGAVPFGITILAGQTTVTGASLTYPNSTVFVSGWTATASYTLAERTAILNYVMSGGNFLGQFDDTGHSIADLFGVTQNSFQADAYSTITNSGHVIMNGPFGTVTSLIGAGNIGQFSVAPGVGQVLATNTVGGLSPGASVIVFERGALGPSSGRVVIENDANMGSDSEGGGDDTVFLFNTLAYLCGVPNIPGGNTYYFAQIAEQGGYVTTPYVSNSSGSSSLNGWIWDFFNTSGALLNTCSGTLVSNGSDGCSQGGLPGTVFTGWSRARSPSYIPLFAQQTFSFTQGGTLFTVGVPPSAPGKNFTLVGPFSASAQLGIAFVNLPTSSGTAHIQVTAYDINGSQIGNIGAISLAPGNQTAAFIGQIVGAASGSAYTSVTIASDQQIAVMGLIETSNGGLASVPVFPARVTVLF